MKKEGLSEIEKTILFITETCRKQEIIVHRYDSSTSSSVYLKFDYGLAHSLRISDHRGIERYHYRFNLIKGLHKPIKIRYKNENYSFYYPFKDIYACLNDILSEREKVIKKYGDLHDYLTEVNRIQERLKRLSPEKLYPFWRYGRRIV